MSVVVTVAGIAATSVGAPVFTGICAAVSASLGMRLLQGAEQAAVAEQLAAAEAQQGAAAGQQSLEVTVATESALSELVAERCELTFAGDAVSVTVRRDIRGRISVTAHGEGLTRAEVADRAEAVLGRIRQQLAYRQIMQKMKSHGFAVSTESQQADGTVRVHIRKRKKS